MLRLPPGIFQLLTLPVPPVLKKYHLPNSVITYATGTVTVTWKSDNAKKML